ncbi:MAG: hypothetical protein HY905_04640 [Deltaproteobacteria bacterium]|nr:hypothetical protein [Deltaproteobacteria bacterium]
MIRSEFLSRFPLRGGGLLLALSLVATGCQKEGDDSSASCTRDEALIAQNRTCRADDDCPCGAGCVLGRCAADCLADADCGNGFRCDQFGRCRDADDRALIAPLAPAGPSGVVVEPPVLRFSSPDEALVVRLRPTEAGPLPVRVVADDGVELECTPGGGFAPECELDLEDGEVTLGARLTGPIGPEGAGRVRVFYADREVSLSATDQPEGGRTLPAEESLEAGVYAGTAVLFAVGVSDDPTAEGQTVGDLAVPLTAQLFLGGTGTGTLVLEDPLGMFATGGRWIGAVTESGSTAGTIDFPTVAYLTGEVAAETPTEVLLDAPPAAYAAGASGFHFELLARFDGILMGERRPFARWRVALNRTGNLPADARPPAVPADASATLPATRGQNPTPWEEALGAAATPNPSSIISRTAAEKAELLDVYGRRGAGGSLEACNLPATVVGSLAQTALNTTWGPEPASGVARVPPIDLTSSGLPIVSRFAAVLATQPAVSVSAVLRPSTPARTLPCAAAFPRVDAVFAGACGADESRSFMLGTLDLCDEAAEAFGCEVVEVAGATMEVQAQVSYEDPGGCVRSNAAVTATGTVTRVCRMAVVPASCAEMALCYEPPATGGTDRASVDAPYLGTGEPLFVSGDLPCGSGARTAAIDADINAELPVGDPDRLDAAGLIDVCRLNLATVRDAPAPTLAPYGAGMRDGFAPGVCVDGPRLLYAMGLATDSDRRRALGADEPVLPLASALSNRLFQRWLTQHAYIARESAEAERMAQVFRAGERPEDPVLPPAAEVLAASLAGWQPLLHPRFATAVDQLPASVVFEPDYRPLVTGEPPATEPHHDEPIALPVTMMETLGAQLALVEPRLEQAALSRDETALPTLASALRHAAVLWPLAAELAARATSYASEHALSNPAWLDRWDQAARDVRAELGRLTAMAGAILRGDNPLGIEEEDTPLYFMGDESSATTRFSAISDFLLGTGPGSFAWVPIVVERAGTSLAAAREAWLARRERDTEVAQSSAELEAQLEAIRTEYGDRMVVVCGLPDGYLTTQLLEEWHEFNPDNCFVRTEDPVCEFDAADLIHLMSASQVQYQMCLVGEVRRTVGFIAGFTDDTLNRIADHVGDCPTLRFPIDCPDGSRGCVECRSSVGTLVAPVSPATFRSVGGMAAVGSRVVEDAMNRCKARFPGVDTTLPGPDDLPDSPADHIQCYSGSMGEAAYGIRTAFKDLEIARSEFAEFQETYDITMKSCLIQQVGALRLAQAEAAHNANMLILKSAKLAADLIAVTAGAVKDCASSLDVITDAVTFTGKTAVACGAAFVGAAATAVSQGLDFTMDLMTVGHEALMTSIEADISDKTCFNDAELALVGQKTAVLRIEQAVDNVEQAHWQLNELIGEAFGSYWDGQAALAATRARYVPPMTHDLWMDEAVNRFLRDMRLARRMVYLAARAIEYQTQQSLGLDADILAAQHPDQLARALDELYAVAGTRTVAGARPTDLKVVLSLRDELLQLADRSGQPEGEQALTDVERFRLLIQSPRFAVYDDTGAYTGQQIPFDLVPLGTMQLGEFEGIPVLAANDCAERVWGVNASIIGSDNMYAGGSPTFTRLDLLKQNTFYSQWCTSGADQPFQVASVRPSRNLFRDPVYGGDYGEGLGPQNESQVYSRARIEAYFNVDRESFEADDYANGETSELAARGLYGKYALFIPVGVLSLDGSRGLVLNEVDDILLRLDYVSVAR